ncbi:NB-ARC domains-containing protein [Tanacetum coccineum]|uniref:ADP-ribosyl cyclase/cyclic ADP-ribose hydrolase n=1 Tax=Tanacetum coccineum TaxID=301880 RepID=A0ABQ5J408_9ASTR
MDHLFNDFKQKGIHAFRDERELPKGEEISPHLYKAIEESRFLIVIFSKDYASSSWCLRELVKILRCKQMGKPKHEVQIIFYDVKPDVVRKQTESYAEAFAKHQVSNRPEVDNWKEALSMAANLSGWDLQDMTNGFESKFIDFISKDMLKKLCDGPLHIGENLVGIDFHFDKLDLSRFVGSDKVNMIGICGISGIGKTTIAKAIYNLMYVHFEGSCFCEDVKEVTKRQGLIQVQLYMIGKIMKIEDLKISSVGEGITIIKKMMSSKPILLVLDDVDDHEELEALAGSAGWFCPGSLIIFTGKDKQFLRSHRVDEIHDMDFLDEDRSLELFLSYAFKGEDSSIEFKEVSQEVVKYVQGHPLALKVLGRFLYEKTVGQWVSELDKLKVYPNEQIQQVLRLSYDGLDLYQKNILLDIACLFVGENMDFVASVLDGCNFFADTNMKALVDNSLITISSDMSVQMHDLIQAMARGIVREESIMPGKQIRLWNLSDVYDLLSGKKVEITEAVEVLVLLLEKSSQKVHIDAASFAHLKKLRILKIYQIDEFPQEFELKNYNVKFSGSLYFLSNELRLFCWHGCPFKSLPSDFYPENIVVVDLSYSNIKQLWTIPKSFRRLKVMKLRYCCNLTTTPDFSEITNLEELDLEGCVNLVIVHPSIGMLKRLVVLNMRDCKRAMSFPSKVVMDSLQVLNLSGCLNVNQPPEAIWSRWFTFGLLSKQQHPQRSVSLAEELNLQGNNLLEVPKSIGGLSCLKRLNLKWNNLLEVPESIGGLSCLKHLNLNWNNLLEVPESIGGLTCLKDLYLNGNNFTSLPGSLSQLFHLRSINVDGCKKLEVLPELPPSLSIVMARDCTSLCSITGSSEYPFMTNKSSYFRNCPKLFTSLAIDSQSSISETQCLDSSITSQGFTNRISSFLQYASIHNNRYGFFHFPGISVESTDIFFHFPGSSVESTDIIYAGNSIPEWFTDKSMGNHIKVELPSDWCYDKFIGFGTCVVFKRKKPCRFIGNYSIENFDGASLGVHFPDSRFEGMPITIHESYMIWQYYEKNTRCTQRWKEAKKFVTFCFKEDNEDIQVKEFGVRLLYHGDLEQDVTNLIMFHLCFRKNGLAPYFGRIVGRVANTTKEGKFTFNWTDYNLPVNNGPDTLHAQRIAISLLTMATTSVPHRWKYDVFVSFRGDDIRKGFMDHMFSDFKQKGIHAFRDDRQLPKGEAISPHLYNAIEESRFLIVVFSKNYASSSWCLRELVKILEFKQTQNPKHEVGIIFYDVKPDVVSHQTDSYAEAIDKHQRSNRPAVDNWKKALSMAADLSGWDLQDTANGYESKFIDCISKEILNKLCDGPLDVGENLVGIDIHLDKLDLSHFIGSDKVNMIGICGISGLGKTTLVKAIYNLMYVHFEGSCFCEDVHGVSKRQGLTQVQMHMINKITKTEDREISNVGEGISVIKKMSSKILLVLDDVDDHEQLKALASSPDWFCPGSLIIFTSKDKQLLRSHKVDLIYEMEPLDDYEALELFSRPLALIVIGRLLYEKPVDVWKSESERLQTYPNSDILQKLRPSFDGLASDQKTMFRDIACAFIGENKDFAASVLGSSHCSANAIIEVLADKFLITVSANRLQMHELIQSMAREIMREEFAQNHRRLWISSEDYDVPNVNKVTEEVEVLVLLLKKNCQNIPIDGQALTRMKNLRILKICFPKVEGCCLPFAVNFYGRLDSLSNKLRLLYWHGLPLKFLPLDFYPENIVTIDLSYSNIKQLWTTPKCFKRLRFMKLRYCLHLTSTPDFTDIVNLEELILEGYCTCLKSFPSNLEMDSLQILILSGCLKLDKLPEDLGRIKSLTELHADKTGIKEVPSCVSSLINLESLSIGGQGRIQPRWWTSITSLFGLPSKQQYPQRSVSLSGFHMLKSLNFSYCNLEQVPESIGGLLCLDSLYLNGNNFTSLPGSLSQLPYLRLLEVNGCKKLEVLHEFPPSLYRLYARDCTSLCSITGFSIKKSSYLSNCPKLFTNLAIDSQASVSETQCLDPSITPQDSQNRFSSLLQYVGIQNNIREFFRVLGSSIEVVHIIYDGNSIPEWFTNRSMGNYVKVKLPSDWCFNRSARKGAVTFCFEDKDGGIEVKECGARVVCDEDFEQDTNLSLLVDLPSLSQHGGELYVGGPDGRTHWTCKDKQLLKSHKVDRIYEMEPLDDYEALELFSLYAFGKRYPTKDFEDVASQIVKYLQGHPLALIVIGRLLYEKPVDVWKSELERLQTYPNSDILRKLRPSFDGLASDQKTMFRDIACAFIGENKDFAASVLDSSHCSANAIIEVLADKFLITVSANHLQMHELIQSMAREIMREEFKQNHRSLWISSEDNDVLNVNKVTEEVEGLVLLLKKNCQSIPIDGQALTRMKNLRILKICFPKVEGLWQPFALNFSGRLDFLSNKLRLLYWHGMPLKFLPPGFYPENIVAIDFSYSHIQHLWTAPKCLRRLKVMKLRYCCNLTTTPDFSEITNLEELDLEGFVNLVSVHPSIGMLKRLVMLNLTDCKRLQKFSNLNQPPEAVWSTWWTSIRCFIWNQQHPQRSVSLAGLHMLKKLNLSYCNLEQVPESIGGLSCLKELDLVENNFTSLRGLSQLSHLQVLYVAGCKKLEVLAELPPSLEFLDASHCTSLCSVTGSSKDPIMITKRSYLDNCPKLFTNFANDSQLPVSETQCLDSSLSPQGATNRFSSFLESAGIQNKVCEFFRFPGNFIEGMDIVYQGNSIPEWFTNKSMGSDVKVELPSDWCFNNFRGYGTCVVYKRKIPCELIGHSVKNFDGSSLGGSRFPYFHRIKPRRINESYVIWLRYTRDTRGWNKAKNFVTFSLRENNEDIEVKECGIRLICDEDFQQDVTNLFPDLPTPLQYGGGISLSPRRGVIRWSW